MERTGRKVNVRRRQGTLVREAVGHKNVYHIFQEHLQ